MIMDTSSLDDIIFEGRNKEYGAYQLRSRQTKHSIIGFGAGSFLILLLFAGPLILQYLKAEEETMKVQTTRTLKYSELSAPPPIEIDRPPDPVRVAPKVKSIKYLKPVAKPDEEVPDEEDLPTLDELAEATPSTVDIDAPDSVIYDIEDVGGVEEEIVDEPFVIVEIMPRFPGGEQAMFEFLGQHLTYPSFAAEVELEGRVYVSFIVDATGKVSDAKIERGIGMGCDEEALRVVNMMPDWSPGQQGGRFVPVKYVLPIAFVIE